MDSFVTLLVGAFNLLVGGASFLAVAGASTSRGDILRRGVPVTGVVRKRDTDEDGDPFVIIGFALNGTEYFLPAFFRTEQVGETVALTVDPADPTRATTTHQAHGGWLPILSLALLAWAVVGVVQIGVALGLFRR